MTTKFKYNHSYHNQYSFLKLIINYINLDLIVKFEECNKAFICYISFPDYITS